MWIHSPMGKDKTQIKKWDDIYMKTLNNVPGT